MAHSVAHSIREVSTTKKSFPAGFVTSTAWYQKKRHGYPARNRSEGKTMIVLALPAKIFHPRVKMKCRYKPVHFKTCITLIEIVKR